MRVAPVEQRRKKYLVLSGREGAVPLCLFACCLALLGGPLGGPWTGACGRGVRNGAFRACFRETVAC